MVVTLTLNPSLDYVMDVPHYQSGTVNRAARTRLLPGGKGINVALMLSRLGTPARMLGFLGGAAGKQIDQMLKGTGAQTDFIFLPEGESRINVKLKGETETEVNAAGPDVPQESMAMLYQKLDMLCADDFLVLAGSVPVSLPKDCYRQILAHVENTGVHAVVDAEGEWLSQTLPLSPFLIKPNHHELGDLVGRAIVNAEDALQGARELQKRGARNVLVSMAEQGAALLCENGETMTAAAPKGTPVHSTGAGDSMVAGFLAGYLKDQSFQTALRYGCCAGSATAFCEGLAEGEQVMALYRTTYFL